MKKILIVIFSVIILMTGCNKQLYEANPTRELEEALKEDENIIEEIISDLVIADESTTSFFVIDDMGNAYETTKIGYTGIHKGMIVKECKIVLINDILDSVSYGEDRESLEIYLSFESDGTTVELNSANEILKNYLKHSDVDTSILEYNVTNTEVIEQTGEHIKKVRMTFNVEPDIFSYIWGQPDEEGWINDLSYIYTLYGANNKWSIIHELNPYINENGLINTKTTLYEPTEIQRVLYENETYTYYQEYQYEEETDGVEEDNDGNIMLEHNTTIRRVNRENGEEARMYSGDQNYDFYPVLIQGKDLYVETHFWEPYGEGSNGYFGILDLDRKYMTEIVSGPVYYGTNIGDIVYLFTNDMVLALDATTNKVEELVELPVKPSVSKGGVEVLYVDENVLYIGIIGSFSTEIYNFNIEDNTFGFVKSEEN